jgi:Zn finger protein HypA/HybF involved in hydrogenase expression
MKFPRLNRYRTGGTSSNMKLGFPPPRTPDGRVYRLSPNESAQPRHFVLGKVVAEICLTDALRARMKHEPRTKQTVCPYSGTVANDDAFTHPDDVEAALEVIKHDAAQDIEDALAEMFKNAFRGSSSSKSLVKITANVKRSTPKPKPRFARRDLMRELVCDHCGRDYGVFAIALFCPDCGAPNLRLHFARETELVDDQVSLAEEIGIEKEELAYRLLGNAHEDVLTAFEATLKTVYVYGKTQADTDPLPKIGNDFQNVDKALRRFEEVGLNPFQDLTEPEIAALRLNIQKRHIIGHNLGVVDDKFAAHANDAKIGETVHLVGEDIRQFAAISQKVIDKLDTWLGGAPSPTINRSLLLPTIKEPSVSPDDPKKLMALDLRLSLLARKVGVWVAEQCFDGRRNFVDPDKLKVAFEENPEDELEEAIAELHTDGFVEISRTLGSGLPHFRPTLDLYLTFDGPAFGRDPIADTVAVAELALSGPASVSAEKVFAQTGWDIRRFNPAFEHVASQIPDGRVSRSFGTQFTVPFFHLLPEDRVHVKRLISRLNS